MLYEMHELLHGNFDDDFGTYRIFLWKRTFAIFPEYPILGSGPDSFAIRFMARYTADVASIGELTINDTAANVYLTMLINIGIVGLLDYLAFLFFQVIEGIKKINKYSAILLISVLCYMIQDCFNLSLVIVTPIFWLLMALHINSLEGK
jgi:O-antigen ligase